MVVFSVLSLCLNECLRISDKGQIFMAAEAKWEKVGINVWRRREFIKAILSIPFFWHQ